MIKQNNHITSLDGLRTLAVAAVVVTHYAPGDSILRRLGIDWAVIGVHLFFVLSGFLITKLLIEKYFEGVSFAKGFAAFWIARTFRIVPLAFFAIAVVWIFSPTALPLELLTYNLTFTSNFYTAKTNDWLPYTGHFWSLAVEMQFYLLYPFFIWMVRKHALQALIVAMGALLLIQEIVAKHSGFPGFVFLLPARADAFMWGGVLFCLSKQLTFPRTVKVMALVGAIIYVGQSFCSHTFGTSSFIPQMLIGNVLFAGIVGMTMVPGSLLQIALSNRVLVHFGKISYGIYIWHPIMWLVYARVNASADGILYHLPLLIDLLVLTIVFSELSWLLFEKKLNSLGHRWSMRILQTSSKSGTGAAIDRHPAAELTQGARTSSH
jgi:peptidoglycan/LPS O-acetylase OafA/YrhL